MINSNNEISSINSIGCDPIYFIETITNNKIGNFYGNVDGRDGEEIFNMEFYDFTTKLKDLYNFVTECGTEEPKYLEEIIFLSKYIDLLFKEAKKENGDLLSVFKNEEDKSKFYELLPEYFGGNYHNKIMEIREHTPGFTKADSDRIDQEAKEKLEEEKRIQEEKDRNKIEEIREGVMSKEEIEKLLYGKGE